MRHVDVWRLRLGVDDDARAIVRDVLAGYLDTSADALTFVHGAHGKPELVGAGRLRFNFARSGDVAVVAVAQGRDVGVDVERIAPARAHGPIADRLFSESEAAALRALGHDDRTRRFFQLWTHKEAYAKALGYGMAVPLRMLQAPRGWTLVDLPLGAEHAGALCVRGRRARVRLLA